MVLQTRTSIQIQLERFAAIFIVVVHDLQRHGYL